MFTTLVVIATFLVAFLLGRASTIAATSGLRTALREATWRAEHDPLTGLPNRTAAMRHLLANLDRAAGMTLALVDLDDFKLVNDQYGHLAGDQLLTALARRLAGFAHRHAAAAYRISGDEFLLILPVTEHGRSIAPVGELLAELGRPVAVTVDGTTVSLVVSASAGLARSTRQPAAGPEQLLHRADIALHHAKATGRPAVRYRPGMPMPAPVPARRRRLRDHPHTTPPPGFASGHDPAGSPAPPGGAAQDQEGTRDV